MHEDYKDNYKAIFTPIPKYNWFNHKFLIEPFPYMTNDRVCQMEIYKRDDFEFETVSKLSGNDRGGGFGSTGK